MITFIIGLLCGVVVAFVVSAVAVAWFIQREYGKEDLS